MDDRNATDAAIRAKLREFPVPPSLRHRILAERKIVRVPFWQNPVFLAAAAALIILGVSLTWLLPTRDFDRFRADMVKYVSVDYKIEVKSAEFAELQRAFATAGWPADYIVPVDLQNVEVEGGCLLRWHGKKISQLCLETKDHKDIWLFVADSDAFPPVKAHELTLSGFPTKVWSDANNTYLLITAR